MDKDSEQEEKDKELERLEHLKELLEYYEIFRLECVNKAIFDCKCRLLSLTKLKKDMEKQQQSYKLVACI